MSNFLTYTAVIETDSGVLKFEFETDETTVGGITATAIDIAYILLLKIKRKMI